MWCLIKLVRRGRVWCLIKLGRGEGVVPYKAEGVVHTYI